MIEAAFGVLSFAIAIALTPSIGRALEKRGYVGVDLHKGDGRRLPEMTGLAVLLGFSVSLSMAYVYYHEKAIIHGLIAVLLVGLIGLFDGVRKLEPREKIVGLAVAGLILLPIADTTLFGADLGLLYLLGVPIFFAFTCNFTNMLAGFNGLEIGTGAIASMGIAVLSLLHGAEASFLMASVMAGGLLGLLYYNRYPARVFPGDVGTLPIGAALFTAIILGKFEVLGIIVFIPYAVDAALKYFSVGVMTKESQEPTVAREG
ncbi:MAG: hypothetical protein ACE5G7_02300, partial [Candidatus Hydrothermarchaeaceae archaeon]